MVNRVLLLHFLIEGKANSVTQITKWANQRQAPENVRVQSPTQYSLFQNGRHSFPCKLALMASLSNVKFKKIFNLERGHKGQFAWKQKKTKMAAIWNKVYSLREAVPSCREKSLDLAKSDVIYLLA